MVALQQPFNVQSVEPFAGFEPIPEGWYKCIIEESELKPTAANDGGYIEFKLNVIEGQYQNRKVFERLNIYNKNQQTVEIAYKQLSAIGWCVGIFNIQDTTQLHNIPLLVHVTQAKNERDGGMTNRIRGYKDINGNEPWKAGGSAPMQQQPQAQPIPQQAPQQPPQAGWQQPQQTNGPMPQQGGAPWQQQPPAQAAQPPAQAGWQQPASQPTGQQPTATGGAPSGPAGWQQGAAPTPPWSK